MNKLFKMLLSILIDQRAEGEGAGAAGAGAAGGDGSGGQGKAPQGGQGGAPGAEGDQGGEGNEGGEGAEGGEEGAAGGQGAAAKPQYGKYKTPEELWQAHQDLSSKTSQTEANAAKLRKTLEASGIKIATDAQGNMMLVPVEEKKERQKKFTDEQKKKLALYFGDDPEKGVESATGFLGLIQNFFEDMLEDQFYQREEASNQRNSQVSQFRKDQSTSQAKMLKRYPELNFGNGDEPLETFNQAFYDRATEIYKEFYSRDPRGELLAAVDADLELGITENRGKQIKQEGFKQGQSGKKVLGPAGGGQGKTGGSGKTLSKTEYMALTPEKRDEYDRTQLQLSK